MRLCRGKKRANAIVIAVGLFAGIMDRKFSVLMDVARGLMCVMEAEHIIDLCVWAIISEANLVLYVLRRGMHYLVILAVLVVVGRLVVAGLGL